MAIAQQEKLNPRFTDGDAMRVIGLLERYSGATMARIPDQWRRFGAKIGEVRGRTDPAQFGLCYPVEAPGFVFDYMTAVMVDAAAPVPDGFVSRDIPPRRYAVFENAGGVQGLRPLLDRIFNEWLPMSGHKAATDPLHVEVYGEDFDTQTLVGTIEVWVPITDRFGISAR